ncbi:hypothetical protein Q3G72_034243 [Acer saccharum]|nr:hypothetical protein Q3G72_034243 [Acer saccharum]
MENNNNHQNHPHAIIIPYPLQGHVIPFVHLAMKLASKGFTITFVNTHSIHHQITKATSNQTDHDNDIFSDARKSGLDIRYKTVNDGFPLGFDRSLNHDQFMEGIFHVFSAHVDQLVGDIVRNSDPQVSCLIADTFYVWSSMISKKYNLINISFWTEPALVLNLYYHLDLLRAHGHFASIDNREDTIDYIPGVRAIEPKDLMSYLQATDTSTIVHKIMFKAFADVKMADFIICNTVQELEPATLTALQEKQPTYAIGPIFPTGFAKSPVATSLWSESECTQWLHNKPPKSVLYVSFGSYAHASKNDIVEIAEGLLLSQVGGEEACLWGSWSRFSEESSTVNEIGVSFEDFDELLNGFKDHILAITGQAGVGKSGTIHMIASHPVARLYEWNTPTPNCNSDISIGIPTAIVVTECVKVNSGDYTPRNFEELQSSLENAGACKVAFNPIANNSMKKSLLRICRQEQCSLTAEQIDLLAKGKLRACCSQKEGLKLLSSSTKEG